MHCGMECDLVVWLSQLLLVPINNSGLIMHGTMDYVITA